MKMDDPLKGYRHETPTSRLRWRGDVLEQKWLITDKDGVSNPAYEWRAVECVPQRSASRRPTHPGAIFREDVLPALGLTPEQAAEAMGLDVEVVRWILAETASVTPELAEAIGKLAGNGPNLWLRMQEAHDRYHPSIKEAVDESMADLREAGLPTSIVVTAHWDETAGVWVAGSDGIAGLATEAATVDELREKVRLMIPDLIELNIVSSKK